MVGGNIDHTHRRQMYVAAGPSRRNYLITIWCGSVSGSGYTCEKPLGEWLLVPPFTRAFLKSPSSRGLSAIAELLVYLIANGQIALGHLKLLHTAM